MSDGACLMNVLSLATKTELFDPTTVRNGGQRSTSNREVRNSYVLCVQYIGSNVDLISQKAPRICVDGVAFQGRLVCRARCVAVCEMRAVASVEEEHDVERVTETMRVST